MRRLREASDCEKVPRKEWREWTHLIVEGLPLPFALPRRRRRSEEPPEVTALDRGTTKDYLTGAGEWDPEKDEFFVEPEPDRARAGRGWQPRRAPEPSRARAELDARQPHRRFPIRTQGHLPQPGARIRGV